MNSERKLEGLKAFDDLDPSGAKDIAEQFWKDAESDTGRSYETLRAMFSAIIAQGYYGPDAWPSDVEWSYNEALEATASVIRSVQDVSFYDPEADDWHCRCPKDEEEEDEEAEQAEADEEEEAHQSVCPHSPEYLGEPNMVIPASHIRLENFRWYHDIYGGWP